MTQPDPTAAKTRKQAKPGVFRSQDHRYIVGLAALTAIIFATLSLVNPSLFLTVANLQSMAFQFPEYAILALAMMLAMLTGGIDLSVIGTANLSSIAAAMVMTTMFPQNGANAALVLSMAAATGLLVGGLCGLINGLCIAGIGIPPILATLGTGLIYTGLALVVTGGRAVIGFPDVFAVVGNGTIGIVPVPALIFAGLAVAVAFLLNRSIYGIGVYLLGTNEKAARFAGLKNFRLIVQTYIMCGALASLGGLVMISRANSAKADYGQSYLLMTILIAVLGGINPYGGFGRVVGLILAVASLQFLSSGLNMMQVSNFAKELVWGMTLLVVMSMSRIDWRDLLKSRLTK